MASKFEGLVKRGDAKKFHRAVDEYEEQHGELPSLEMASFEELELSGFDFSGIDLANVAFENCTLTQCRFDDTPLGGVFIHGCTLIECYIEGATGNGFCIDASTVSKCELTRCSFEFPEWTDSQFSDCEIVDLTGEDFFFERTTFKGGSWEGVQPESGEFNLVTLRDIDVKNCDLTGCTAKSSYLKGARVTDTELPDGFTEKTGKRRVM
jgi:uncharacterized protein YjbI with pentapeptide repeats